MILDKQLELSDSQAVTSTALSTNVINTLPGITFSTTQQLGNGATTAFIIFQVDTTFTAAGAATLQITIESDSTANLATSPTVHYTSAVIPKADLVPGWQLVIAFPLGEIEKYLGARYTVATGPMTAGAISGFISRDVQTWRPYADALT